ncbi:hypothetical protein R3W88_027533 [Solanum pinnatisectum]|uniref:RING-CH-type domain-containing protein n=1 Tax=Solanum pinnatisectum TaxID=50273 RepID=A0AAV9LHI5_9SOLN|nr:hypothetical protein R3W88_027533 [Solanum pinnatisectum]
MERLEVPQVELECAGNSRRSSVSVSFPDADKGSCYSQFCSTADGSNQDDYSYPRGSESADSVGIEIGDDESKGYLGEIERDCRICHLSLVSCGNEYGVAIELGCLCKDDLAAAHRHCAETWFKIKGNKTCEICNSIARNVVGPTDIESAQQTNEINDLATNVVPAQVSSSSERRTCLNGHRFLNFLLACMVFAFVISWLFHFNIPS